ncbi:BMC domain-containing protein [Lachnoclostridium phytofermentans]|uniref:Microcompartments protein n=1 Tax=Lachnoclostridium phytofermentans (strain ATCC 700394 / DSM 18823 / ISDg) TaxID=357809 RepID=A9KMZ9_LACP7|nr:BMC domain-containing protein [Lachnoclostridium phytofermentans]ABX43010.1 microcompartments protein [Lachnoclostridium phytofermentans ISDg]
MIQIDEKQRIVQEFVPGKQITLAHIIANPTVDIYQKLGLISDEINAIGIMTITPSEGAIVAADIATKASDIRLGFIDRFSGALVITGDVSSVESAIRDVVSVLSGQLLFTPAAITRT